jgi:hypothetical protein
MLPRKLAADQPETERRRWRIVRLDTHEELPGLILSADCDSGACVMSVKKPDGAVEAEHLSFGPGAIIIIRR